jgi:hypothetical protein
LNVEEEDVHGWAERVVEFLECLCRIGCAAGDFKAFMIGEKSLEALNGKRLIVDEIGAEWSCFHRHLSNRHDCEDSWSPRSQNRDLGHPNFWAKSGNHTVTILRWERQADDGLVVFASNFELTRWAVEEFHASDEIAEAVIGSDGVEREAGAVIDDRELNAFGVS